MAYERVKPIIILLCLSIHNVEQKYELITGKFGNKLQFTSSTRVSLLLIHFYKMN